MANAEEKFRMEILAEFNKSGLLKEFKDLTNRIDGAAADKLKQTMDDMGKSGHLNSSNNGSGGEDDSQSFFRGAMRGMRGIMGLLGKLALAVGVISSTWQVLEPAFKILQSISDMIATFLRPITDIFITLLTPIMVMLRPMLQVFNTLMMPFRQLAMEGMSASNQLIGEGTNEMLTGDAELGRGMVSEGMKGALSSAKLMISGFMNVLMSPLTKIPVIGQAIEQGLAQFESDAIKGVLTVINVSDEVNQYLDGVMTKDIFDLITGGVKGIIKGVELEFGLFSIEGVQSYRDEVSNQSEELFKDMRESANEAYVLTNIINDLQGKSYEGLAEKTIEARKTIDDLATSMNEVGNENNDMNSDNRGFFESMWGGVKSGFSNPFKSLDDMNGVEIVSRSITNPFFSGMLDILKISMKYMGDSDIPDAFESGFEHMLNVTNTYMGNNDSSKITTTFNSGMVSMQNNTDKFGKTLTKVTGLLDDATRRMEGYANSYASAKRRIRSLESSLRNARSLVR